MENILVAQQDGVVAKVMAASKGDQPIGRSGRGGVPMSRKPFKVLGIQQIAIGGPTRTASRRCGSTCSAGGDRHLPLRARERRRGHLRDGQGPFTVEVDLMQPMDRRRSRPCTPRRSTTSACGSTICPRGGVAHGEGRALRAGGIRRGAAGHDICFLHPKGSEEFPVSGEGVLIELGRRRPTSRPTAATRIVSCARDGAAQPVDRAVFQTTRRRAGTGVSVPGLRAVVPRPARTSSYRGVDQFEPIEREAEGFHARAVQHECDHLIGKFPLPCACATSAAWLHQRCFRDIDAAEDD